MNDHELTDLGRLVTTADGSLSLEHHEHGECYHSRQGARFEAETLYIGMSGFEEALTRGRSLGVLDVGLGLGYNAIATIAAWWRSPSPPNLTLASLEIHGALAEALASGQAHWQKDWPKDHRSWATSLTPHGGFWRTWRNHASGAQLEWTVWLGDAGKEALPRIEGGWNFVWQDPFSPDKNPALWNNAWFGKVKKVVSTDATLMTYSVARRVRDALTAAGWSFEKVAAAGSSKKHWLKATPLINTT